MTRKFALAALAAAALAAGPMFATEAAAKDGRRTNAAIGIAAGIGGLLIGSAIVNAQPRYQGHGYQSHGYYPQPRGYGHVSHGHVSYGADRYVDEEECFEKPIRRVNHFTGQIVTVGSKTVCR